MPSPTPADRTPGRTLVVSLLMALVAAVVPGLAASAFVGAPGDASRVVATSASARAATYDAGRVAAREAAGRLAAARSALAGDGRDVTEALRRLHLARPALDAADRRAADRLLARPATRKRSCAVVCVHWTTTGRHRATNSWAKQVRDLTGFVHRTLVAAGYRAPKRDGKVGGNAKTDVYVQDLADGLYGYCTSDQRTRASDVWAYCVVDNDYRGFPTGTPLQNLQMTIAHEYFHAVQFGYDAAEDTWLLEGSAAWVEDELFDDVDDNRQYLTTSPLSHPARPLDLAGDSFHYGAWLFFRFLSETLPAAQSSLPTVVRDIWRAADARKGARDLHSTDAVTAVLATRGTDLPDTFARFVAGNRRPAETYDEGSAAGYVPATAAKEVALGLGSPTTWSPRVDHLAGTTLVATPPTAATTVSVEVDLPAGGALRAVATLVRRDGTSSSYLVPLDDDGHGAATAPLPAGAVQAVEVSVANADVRYRCGRGTDYACSGTPLGDGQAERVRVIAR